MPETKKYENVRITPQEKSMVEITVEVPSELLPRYRAQALTAFNQQLDIPGFRKGHIPEKTILERVGEHAVLEEAAERAIRDVYPALIAEHGIVAIGQPEATVTKLAVGNPICFTLRTAIVPDFTLPDYKTIASTVRARQQPVSVTEEDVAGAILQIRKALASNNPNEESRDSTDSVDIEPPELTDEMVRTIGNFKDIADFTERLKSQLKNEKEIRAAEKLRADIGEKLLEEVEVILPDILIDGELEKIIARLKDEARRAGTTFEEYAAQAEKTEDDFRKEWRPDAEKRAILQLVLNKIAETEHIKADSAQVDEHAKYLLKQAKGADPESVQIYVATVLTNDAVFKFLEKA